MELIIDNRDQSMPMTTKPRFIGRTRELMRLRSTHQKNTASFIVIKGRRRIGKSRLIEEFSKDFDHYYQFEGLAPDQGITDAHQLSDFCSQISHQFNAPKAIYQDWRDAFWAVGERVQNGKTLLFFDELSWMGGQSPTFLAQLKSFWDNRLSKNPELVFVVCSSASSWIQKNVLSSTGFVGRISFNLTLRELSLAECNQFWPKHVSAYEKFKWLSVTGGIPKYLEEMNPKESAENNIKALCFTEGALLVNEFQRIFSDLFMRESPFYESIINILASGPKDQSEIQQQISQAHGKQLYGRVPEYLWELTEAGFISRDYTWHLSADRESRLSKYRLQDNYLRFYSKYIKKNLQRINRGAFHPKSLSALPEWHAMIGFQFENLVLNNRNTIQRLLGIQADEITYDNPYFQNKTLRAAGCQIDYMIQTRHNTLYICEIKCSKRPIGHSVIHAMETKIQNLRCPQGMSYRPVLIHVNGVTDALLASHYFVKIIDLGDLLNTA